MRQARLSTTFELENYPLPIVVLHVEGFGPRPPRSLLLKFSRLHTNPVERFSQSI